MNYEMPDVRSRLLSRQPLGGVHANSQSCARDRDVEQHLEITHQIHLYGLWWAVKHCSSSARVTGQRKYNAV
jgi:hypothetical protein